MYAEFLEEVSPRLQVGQKIRAFNDGTFRLYTRRQFVNASGIQFFGFPYHLKAKRLTFSLLESFFFL